MKHRLESFTQEDWDKQLDAWCIQEREILFWSDAAEGDARAAGLDESVAAYWGQLAAQKKAKEFPLWI